VKACSERARLLLENRREGPFHVGILLENVPEFPMLLGAAALAGAAIVGINPTRRGADLARDVSHAECQMLVTEERQREILEGLDLGIPEDRLFDVVGPLRRRENVGERFSHVVEVGDAEAAPFRSARSPDRPAGRWASALPGRWCSTRAEWRTFATSSSR
jgi:acyl-CoA synthetase (AMP-forming)/AMP-acid ligase II